MQVCTRAGSLPRGPGALVGLCESSNDLQPRAARQSRGGTIKIRHSLIASVFVLATQLIVVAASAQQPLVVATKDAPPFVLKGPDGRFSGPAIELWERAADAMGLAYEYRELPLDGLLAAVESGEANVGVGALTVTAERERRFDFTHPYHSTGLGIAARDVEGVGVLSVLRRLFSAEFLAALGALALVLFITGAAVWLLERKRNPEQFGGNTATGLGSGLWWSAVTMTTVGYGDKAPITFGGRMVALVWMFAAVITISGFTAGIASSLTSEQLTSVSGPADLDTARVGTVTGSSSADYLRARGTKGRAFADLQAALDALRKGDLDAVVYDLPLLAWWLEQDPDSGLRLLPHTLTRQDYAFALPAGSELRERLNREILTLTSTPQWRQSVADY